MKLLSNTKISILILILITLFTIFFRQSIHSENSIYQNYDATYHALLTVKALDETPISQHHFLPIVSLGDDADKHIRWGATIPDKYGNYYYTSFPLGGFIFPYAVFKFFNLDVSVDNLFIVSSIILLLSVLIIFIFAKDISKYLNPLYDANKPALLVSIIYLFSMETLYSHGYIYWGHSLMQPIFIFFLYLVFKILTKKMKVYNLFLLLIFSFLLGFTEWSGYLIVFGTMIVLIFSSLSKREKYFYISACAMGGAIALAVFILDFISVVDTSTFFHALESRFFARNFTTNIPISLLFYKYWESYNIFLLLLPLAIILIFFDKKAIQKEKIYTLFLLLIIILFGLLENIVMKQHAIAYNFDRLKFLPLFALLMPILWSTKSKAFKQISILIILTASIYTTAQYPELRITKNEALEKNQLFVNNDKFKKECKPCIMGIAPAVRGYTNLLFNRGIYEGVNIERLQNIALKNNKCACYINVRGIGGGGMIQVLGYKKIKIQDIEIFATTRAYNLTDRNWVKGVSRKSTGFFVSNISKNAKKYQVGARVKFINNEIRTIKKITVSANYINIFVDGKPLDGMKVGYPNKIEVIKE